LYKRSSTSLWPSKTGMLDVIDPRRAARFWTFEFCYRSFIAGFHTPSRRPLHIDHYVPLSIVSATFSSLDHIDVRGNN
jgi:hypothetical protein